MSTWTSVLLPPGEATPWGLDPDLLAPSKTFTDPIHGDIRLTELERQIVDSPAFQRLRHVKQLGTTLKVFPGAEHSRFTHSLGTLQAAQDILDRIVGASHGPNAPESLLDEWRKAGNYELRLAEATVLARLTALIHDLTHVPFGHTIEDDLKVLQPHDENVDRYESLYSTLPERVRGAIDGATSTIEESGRCLSLRQELDAIVLDKVEDKEVNSLYPFVGDVVNNTICADLLDYLKRDHYFTGLPIALGERFMDSFYIAPSTIRSEYAERLILAVTRQGEFRIDIVTELIKYLRYRYEATERALYHKTKLAFDAMLGKLLEMLRDESWQRHALERYQGLSDDPDHRHDDWLRARVEELGGSDAVHGIDAEVSTELEGLFLRFGDEGLIEHLIWVLDERGEARSEREDGVRDLALRIRNRDHYRMLAHAGGREVLPASNDKHNQYGTAPERRRLERTAAKWAGIDPAWSIVLWVPSPKMRLKLADVLIEDRGMISKLVERYEDAEIIARRHQELWAVRVYASAEVHEDADKREIVLAKLRDDMGLPFVDTDGRPVTDTSRLVAERIVSRHQLERSELAAIEDLTAAARAEHLAFEDLELAAEEACRARGLIADEDGPSESP